MRFFSPRSLALLSATLLLTVTFAVAQPSGGRGFGGFGRGGAGGMLGLIGDDKVREELKITDEQRTRIREYEEAQRQNRGERPRFDFQNASKEEQQKFFEDMRKQGEQRQIEAEAKLKEILTAEQFTRLEQLNLQKTGPTAIFRDDHAAALKLTDDQKTKLKVITDDYLKKVTEGGFTMRPEDREKLGADRDTQILALLTAEQKTQWDAKVGPKPADTAAATPSDASAAPAVATTPSTTTPTAPSAPAVRLPAYEPKKPDGEPVVADMKVDEKSVAAAKDLAAKRISFNFRFAPWELVLKRFAEESGLSLDLSVVPPGTFNYFDAQKYSLSEALDILNGYLLPKGYLLMRRDNFLVVLNVDNAIPPNLIPQVSPADLEGRGRYELMTMEIPLAEGDDPAALAEQVKELLSPTVGKVAALVKTNRLIVTDIGDNLRRVMRLMDGAAAQGGISGYRALKLKHVSVLDAEKMIRDLFGLPARGKATVVSTAQAATNTAQQVQQYNPWASRFGGDRGDRGSRGSSRFGGFPGGGFPGGGFPGQPQDNNGQPGAVTTTSTGTTQTNSGKESIQVTSDLRTNTLLVKGTDADLKIVEKAIESIDTPTGADGFPYSRRASTPQLEVYQLQNVDGAVVIANLSAIVPGLQITEDTKARRLSIYALPDEHETIAGIIKQLDSEGGETVTVITLRKTDPVLAATSLRNLFTGQSGAPNIEADSVGRRIMVRGTPEQLQQIRRLLADLGETGEANVADNSGGPVRTLPLNGRDPQEMLELLQRVWPHTRVNPIRVVVPSAVSPTIQKQITPSATSSPVYDERVPTRGAKSPARESSRDASSRQPKTPSRFVGATRPLEADESAPSDTKAEPPAESSAATPCDDDTDVIEIAQAEETAPAAVETPAKEDEGEAQPATSAANSSPVNIAIFGDKLIISSDDPAALNRLQELVDTLAQMQADEPQFTVIYLQSADATETATMLGNLFSTASVTTSSDSSGSILGSLGSGVSAIGSGLADMTGLSSTSRGAVPLRIIPEIRSNSLWVTGSNEQIQRIEEVVKVLDAAELPESLRERVPRSIKVRYADVEEVHAILEDVYKEQLQGANPAAQGGGRGGQPQQSGGFNPLAMILQGAQGGAKGRGVQMTLGLNVRTNTIIVSCSEALFAQVDDLVRDLDDEALKSAPTVQIVPLHNQNSAVVQEALESLVGKVKVSSTRSNNSSNQSQPGAGVPSFGGQSPFGGGFPFSPGGTPGGDSGSFRSRFGGSQGGGNPFSGSQGGSGRFGGGNFGGNGGGGRGGRGGR